MSTALALRTSDAPLPQSYEAAKVALANCTAVDECQDWADKAAALASYARQADDDSLMNHARRIQGRAVRRAGELLKTFNSQGERTDKLSEGDHRKLTMSEAASSAGMSEHQQKTAVRVANLPEADFEAAIESPSPPTVTALSEAGRRTIAAPKPAGFNESIHTMGAMRRFVDKCREHEPELIASALEPYEVTEARALVAAIDAWTDRFITNLKG